MGKKFITMAVIATALLTTACWSQVETTHWVATIEVDGERYTAEAVGKSWLDTITKQIAPLPHGTSLTFRLKDNRVVALKTHHDANRHWHCAPRKDGTMCPGVKNGGKRWQWAGAEQASDGVIFDNADHPTQAFPFQFEPRSENFAPGGKFVISRPGFDGPIRGTYLTAESVVSLVSFSAKPTWRRPSDNLDVAFPGRAALRTKSATQQPPRPTSYTPQELLSAAAPFSR